MLSIKICILNRLASEKIIHRRPYPPCSSSRHDHTGTCDHRKKYDKAPNLEFFCVTLPIIYCNQDAQGQWMKKADNCHRLRADERPWKKKTLPRPTTSQQLMVVVSASRLLGWVIFLINSMLFSWRRVVSVFGGTCAHDNYQLAPEKKKKTIIKKNNQCLDIVTPRERINFSLNRFPKSKTKQTLI